nr:hypothetical protein CFP56_63719 [Quercus suber]
MEDIMYVREYCHGSTDASPPSCRYWRCLVWKKRSYRRRPHVFFLLRDMKRMLTADPGISNNTMMLPTGYSTGHSTVQEYYDRRLRLRSISVRSIGRHFARKMMDDVLIGLVVDGR